MIKWDVYRSVKTDDVTEAEIIASFDDRGTAWEYIATRGDYELYDYMITSPRLMPVVIAVYVMFEGQDNVRGRWECTAPPVVGDYVDLFGSQSLDYQVTRRRWFNNGQSIDVWIEPVAKDGKS